jgi:hypothetical protein
MKKKADSIGMYINAGVDKENVREVRDAVLTIMKAGRGIQVTVAALKTMTDSLTRPVNVSGCSIKS